MVSFALIGCGKIGARHAEHITKQGNLVAVCDIDKNKAESFGEKYGCSIYISLDDLLKKQKNKIDVVSICGGDALPKLKAVFKKELIICINNRPINDFDFNE